MSRRKRSAPAGDPSSGEPEPLDHASTGAGDAREPGWRRGLLADLAILVTVFAVAAGVAELAGAANLGVALGVGQVAFAVALAVLLTRR